MTWPKENSKLLELVHKEVNIHTLPDKEFKIIILNMLRLTQKNTHKQLNEIRKTVQDEKWEAQQRDKAHQKESNRKLEAGEYNDKSENSTESLHD